MNQPKKNAIKEAIHKLGGPTKASNQLSVSNASVHTWINKGTIPDIDIARKVSVLTGIKLDDLRPMPIARTSWF